jgi:class 3 adenylate cyclase
MERKLAADVVGYSHLMEADEAERFARLKDAGRRAQPVRRAKVGGSVAQDHLRSGIIPYTRRMR